MKVLFIGGTGVISTAVSRIAVERGIDLYHLNRGLRKEKMTPGVTNLVADVHKAGQVEAVLKDHTFDAVVDWIAYRPADIERDLNLFRGKTGQFVFISSASAYQKPPVNPFITESTPLYNPYWQYSQDKIACEELLNKLYREEDFPITILRPSLTYETVFPIAIGGWGCYTLADRLLKGKPIIIHGDGSSLWTVTHAEDLGRAFLGLLGNIQTIGHAFHITSDEVLTWNQIYFTIADALGVKANPIYIPSDFIAKINPGMGAGLLGDKACSGIFDNSKIKSYVPGWNAVILFREGARRLVEWFDADPARKWIDDQVNRDMEEIISAYQSGK